MAMQQKQVARIGDRLLTMSLAAALLGVLFQHVVPGDFGLVATSLVVAMVAAFVSLYGRSDPRRAWNSQLDHWTLRFGGSFLGAGCTIALVGVLLDYDPDNGWYLAGIVTNLMFAVAGWFALLFGRRWPRRNRA